MTLHWKEALAGHIRDLRMRTLSPKILTEEGEVIETKKNGTKVLLDKEFAYYCTVERIFRPLGLVVHDKVKKEYLTKVFVPECIAFAEKEGNKLVANRLVKLAQLMSQVNRLPVEENIKILMNSKANEINGSEDEYEDEDFNVYDEDLVKVF